MTASNKLAKYDRVLIKLSGEALAPSNGELGIDRRVTQ